MCTGAGARIWNILICSRNCYFHVFVALISQMYRITKLLKLCSWMWNHILFWCRLKKKVQESLKIHLQCCIVGNSALFWIKISTEARNSTQYIPLFTLFLFLANDFSLQTLLISCRCSTDIKRKCFFFFLLLSSPLLINLCVIAKKIVVILVYIRKERMKIWI